VGAYRFAPDPVQKSESEKQKERKGKKIGGRMLSFARDEVGTAKAIQFLSFVWVFVALIPVMNYHA